MGQVSELKIRLVSGEKFRIVDQKGEYSLKQSVLPGIYQICSGSTSLPYSNVYVILEGFGITRIDTNNIEVAKTGYFGYSEIKFVS